MILDNSILVATVECSTKVVMLYVLHWRSKEPKDAADVGNACHSGWEYHLKGFGIEESLTAFRNEYYKRLGQDPVVEERLGYLNVEKILREWLNRWPLEKLPFIADPQTVESGITVKLNDDFELFCKIDAPVRDRQTGQPWPLDHKTTGRINHWWVRKWKLASQLSGYTYGMQQSTGEIVPGAIINALELGKLPDSSRKCKKHNLKFSECQAQHMVSQIFVVHRSPEVLANWHRDAVLAASKFALIKKVYADLSYIPAVPQEGQFNGSCIFCEFNGWCMAGRPLHVVEQTMVQERWEPWEERK